MAINRETIRDELAIALATAMSSAEEVYNHKPVDFDGKMPVVAVEAVGSQRIKKRFGNVTGWIIEFSFLVHTFVLFSEPTNSWTKQDADDAIDALEQEFAAYMETWATTPQTWRAIEYNGTSGINDNVLISGETYINERIPVKVFIGA